MAGRKVEVPVVSADKLRGMGVRVFRGLGVSDKDACTLTDSFVKASLQGVDSHGVMRIPQYVEDVKRGAVKPGARATVSHRSRFLAIVDGHWNFGHLVTLEAVKVAVGKARRSGVGIVGIFNCGHIGRLADYALKACEADMVGFIAATGPPMVAPFGGVERMLHTGPICFGIPAGKHPPLVIDISTSATSEGKVRIKLRRGEKLGEGWIIDRDGNPSVDPEDLYRGGALLPLGGNVGYKGFGLGLIVDVLAGVLTGAGSCTSGKARGNGVFIMVLDIARFKPVQDFKAEVDNLIARVKSSRTAPGFKEVLMPGEMERRVEEERGGEGVFIDERTWRDLVSLDSAFNSDGFF